MGSDRHLNGRTFVHQRDQLPLEDVLDQWYASAAVGPGSAALADVFNACRAEEHLGFDSAVTNPVTMTNDHKAMLSMLNLMGPETSTFLSKIYDSVLEEALSAVFPGCRVLFEAC